MNILPLFQIRTLLQALRTPILLCSLFFYHSSLQAETLTIRDFWIAEAPPVSKVMAAYLTISNTSDKDITILSANAAQFSSTVFHQTVFEDGMAKMRHQPELTVPAGSSLELKPGSFHMMLFNPVKPLQAGEEIEFQFELANEAGIKATATVKQAEHSHDHSHHSHH